jgi:hypothetical protein
LRGKIDIDLAQYRSAGRGFNRMKVGDEVRFVLHPPEMRKARGQAPACRSASITRLSSNPGRSNGAERAAIASSHDMPTLNWPTNTSTEHHRVLIWIKEVLAARQ